MLPQHKHYAHDIALVELAEAVDTSDPYTRSACLPEKEYSRFPSNSLNKRDQTLFEDMSRDNAPEGLEGPNEFPSLREFMARFRRDVQLDSYDEMYDVERYGECFVTGWGERRGNLG